MRVRTFTSEGQRLLTQLQVKGHILAKELGIAHPSVSRFLQGDRKPAPEIRRELARRYGIAVEAWETLPGALPLAPVPMLSTVPVSPVAAPVAAPPPHAPVPAAPLQDTRDLITAAEQVVSSALTLMRTQQLTPTEAKAAQDRVLKGLESLQKLRHQEEVRESVLAKHPTHRAMMSLICDELDAATLARVVARLESWAG